MTDVTTAETPPARFWEIEDLRGLDFDPLLADFLHNDPVPRIRLPHGEGEAWLVTRYEHVRMVTSDPRFSRRALVERQTRATGMTGHTVASHAGFNYTDPPEHTRLRKVVTRAFTGRSMKRLRPLAEQTCARLLDEVERHGAPADLMALFHGPFPLAVVSDLVGVPEEEHHRLAAWPDLVLSSGPGPERSRQVKAELTAYIVELLERRRREPREDLATVLADALDRGEINRDEAISVTTAIQVSGAHAVRNNSANMVYALLTHPEHLARLRARPELLTQAVDELLRFIPHRNGVGLPRVATEDVEVGGVLIRAGEVVYASYLAANWDPEVYDDPDVIDFDRTASAHMAFGHGPHHCIGAQLTRMESEVMLSGLLGRFPQLRLAVAPEEMVWQRKGLIRGPQSLPVTW
ncbi:cytochrome P450 [Streptomyces sp. LP05-1]|uniref:Cytochrome P450 n=1 Tax=Streptomyces pyxinae TaxID=2970734 RepID=A0ABT2CDD7_9ACTN|nr:cytochrome P450 [Streptomyces sp. LP05-1]MCS0635399.1 cytochrome P450 [Streptomyces sp. LP05-1]